MSGWMVDEWGGDGSELASAQLNLHQPQQVKALTAPWRLP